MDPRRWSPLTYLAPTGTSTATRSGGTFDFRGWADEDYRWVQDRWNGFLDLARRLRVTVAAGAGDSEDFALVAVSWAVANDHDGIGLGFCFEPRNPIPRHVVAYDDTNVYSSGDIEPVSVDAWLADSERYRHVLRRRVRL